jgi:hypothetical protein
MADPDIVRTLMAATVMDTKFLKGLRKVWRDDLSGDTWGWLGNECFRHLKEHGKAPGRDIQLAWATIPDPVLKRDMERFLAKLSNEWDDWEANNAYSVEALLKEAEKYFAQQLYLIKAAELEAAAEAGDIEAADEIVSEMKPPKLSMAVSIVLSENPNIIREAFEHKVQSLVGLGGAFQELVGEQVVKDSFVAFLGKEKVGKSWILQALAFSAAKARQNVMYCQCGDLSQRQQVSRFSIQLSGRSNRSKYNRTQLLPVPDCFLNQTNECNREERLCSVSVVDDLTFKPYPKLAAFDSKKGYIPCFRD